MADTMTVDTLRQDYADPVACLLTEGDGELFKSTPWPDYVTKHHFGREHIPDLIRMACDMALHLDNTDDSAIWAPVHAWRTLAQLRAEEAIEPLATFMLTPLEDDAVTEEFPTVFGMIGPAAIPAMAALAADRSIDWEFASAAGRALKEIAVRHPEWRDACLGFLTQALAGAGENDRTANGLLICSLLDMKAVEAIDTIREAFRLDAVDISIPGDLEDVEIALGLRTRRSTPKPSYHPFGPKLEPLLKRFRELVQVGEARSRHAELAAMRVPRKLGRNDPCPCGSGKKHKKCCLT